MPRTSLILACVLALSACKPAPTVAPEPTPGEATTEPETARDDGAHSPGDELDPDAGDPDPDPDPRDLDAATKQALSETIRTYLAELQSCYEAELKKDRSLAGKMTYTITVEPSGRVSAVLIDRDEVGSEAVRECATAQIEAWSFAGGDIEEPADVTFSVNFTAV